MYKTSVRRLIRYSIKQLNEGDYSMLLRMGHPDFALAYPGDNSLSTMFRPIERSRETFYTHRGVEEAEGFAKRLIEHGAQIIIEDILVNGPPSNTRVALRVVIYVPDADGSDAYNNREVLFITIRWGRIVSWEDYLDTERMALWDAEREQQVANKPVSVTSE